MVEGGPGVPPPKRQETPGSVGSSTRTRKHGMGVRNYVNRNNKSTVLVVGGETPARRSSGGPPSSVPERRGARTPSDAAQLGHKLEKLVDLVDPLTFKKKDDYLLLRNISTKLETTKKLRDNFRKMDQNQNGSLQMWELKAGLEMSNFGLADEELARIVKTMDKNGDLSVDYDEFIGFFDNLHPLVDGTIDDQKMVPVVDNLETAAPWEPLVGNLRVFNKDQENERRKREGAQEEHFQPGSYEQRQSDKRVYTLLMNKFYQNASKIRHVFRKFDVDKNGTIDKGEFVRGLSGLGMGMSNKQLSRFYDMVNTDGDDHISYDEFITGFENADVSAGSPLDALVQSLHDDVEPESPQRILAEDMAVMEVNARKVAHSLRDKIYRSGNGVYRIFKQYDVSGDGQLSKDEFRRSLRTIEPTIQDEAVDVLLHAADTGHNGRINYHEFLAFVEASERPPDLRDKRLVGHSPIPDGPGAAPPPSIIKSVNPTKGMMGSSPAPNWSPTPGYGTRASSASTGGRRTSTPGERFAESGLLGRTGRFSHTPTPKDTRTITEQGEGTPGYAEEGDRFKHGRDKRGGSFLDFQAQDKERRERERVAKDRRNQSYLATQSRRAQTDQDKETSVDMANVNRTATSSRRYLERQRMYELSVDSEQAVGTGKGPIENGFRNFFTQTTT